MQAGSTVGLGSPGDSNPASSAAPNDAARPGGVDIVEPEPQSAAAVFGERIDLARRYVAALATDGVLRGLIGPREPGRLWTRHVLNSAAAAGLIGPGLRLVDIGSGAGLPGIPLAIARPDCQVGLVEPLERRVRFLQEVVDSLVLTNCSVVRGRAEDVVDQCGGADVVISRAVAPLHRLVSWSAPLARVDGWVLAMKGSTAAEELARDARAVTAAGLVDAEVIEVGGGEFAEPTYVIRARRTGGTPARPRRDRGRR